jgi:hypothetical protein
MSMILQFAPWLSFLIVTDVADWRLGLAAGLIATILTILASKPRRVGVLNAAMIVFFIAMGAFALIRPDSGLQDWAGTISTAWIAVVSAASILVGRPFTLDFSRDGVSPEIAQSKLFLDINRSIAWAWTGAFAVMAASRSIAHAADRPALATVLTVVVLIAAIKFTKAYPDRAVAAATGTPTPATASARS